MITFAQVQINNDMMSHYHIFPLLSGGIMPQMHDNYNVYVYLIIAILTTKMIGVTTSHIDFQ